MGDHETTGRALVDDHICLRDDFSIPPRREVERCVSITVAVNDRHRDVDCGSLLPKISLADHALKIDSHLRDVSSAMVLNQFIMRADAVGAKGWALSSIHDSKSVAT